MNVFICKHSQFGCDVSQSLLHFFGGSSELQKYSLIAFGLLILTGIVLGMLKKITVFRDYADVSTVVATLAGPPILIFVLALLHIKQTTPVYQAGRYLVFFVESMLVVATVIGTCKDNKSIWKIPLALVTKYTISLGFVVALLCTFTGSSRNQGESYADYQARNAHSRNMWLGFLAMLSGLIALLVRDQAFRKSSQAGAEVSSDAAEWEEIRKLSDEHKEAS